LFKTGSTILRISPFFSELQADAPPPDASFMFTKTADDGYNMVSEVTVRVHLPPILTVGPFSDPRFTLKDLDPLGSFSQPLCAKPAPLRKGAGCQGGSEI
jgi:hypothetical protein